jgi:1,4-alpha-glucan branching enzyme
LTFVCYRATGAPQPHPAFRVNPFLATTLERLAPELALLAAGRHGDPGRVLGRQLQGARAVVVSCLPGAVRARLHRRRDFVRFRDSALFVWAGRGDELPARYRVSWEDAAGGLHEGYDPYCFDSLTPANLLERHARGVGDDAGRAFGSFVETHDGVAGLRVATWAPRAGAVTLALGDGRRWPMRPIPGFGAWEIFVPGLAAGCRYGFEVWSGAAAGRVTKTDPYGRQFELRPKRRAIALGPSVHIWQDTAFVAQRGMAAAGRPLSIYELHLGSFRRRDGRLLRYPELAEHVAAHAGALGFTHVELLPVTEHPHDASWGYQATGYFAPTSRHGTPDEFRAFVDRLHAAGIGVILDWVPGHFASDPHALARFDGAPLYEYADPRRGRHLAWGTLVFDFERPQVRSFLLASARTWIEEFHVDGLRVDAVAAMLYLDYQRAAGEWLPNAAGGREHEAAVALLRALTTLVHERFPGVMLVAEESTTWRGVTEHPSAGGLGFDRKWNMGWMHDTLAYFGEDPLFRRHHHERLTFGLSYAWSERYLLPLSHDEVVHGKRSLLGRMPGDAWQRLANLRLLYAWQWTHPGAKLLFMGGELGQPAEWDHRAELPWALLAAPAHAGIAALVADLNRLYRSEPALHAADDEPSGFAWLDCDDRLRSLYAYERRAGDDVAVVVLNATPVPRDGFRIGLPRAGAWREALNTDSLHYGGSNVGNLGLVVAERDPAMGRRWSATIVLPPLAALVLLPDPAAAQSQRIRPSS